MSAFCLSAVLPTVDTVQLSPPPKGDPVAFPAVEPGQVLQIVPFGVVPDGGLTPSGASALLGLPVATSLSLDGTGVVAVRAEVEFVQARAQMLLSRDGSVFEGLPVIGLLVRQFTNGTLEYPPGSGLRVLSNYRGPELMSRHRVVRPPDPSPDP